MKSASTNRLVQWAVALGVWWCILVDALGNWAGQDHAPCWIPIIQGVVAVLVIAHVAAAWRLRGHMFTNLIKRKLKQRFQVTPVNGMPFSGVLLANDRAYSVFADVKVFAPGEHPQQAEGELYIRNDNISYLQLVADVSI